MFKKGPKSILKIVRLLFIGIILGIILWFLLDDFLIITYQNIAYLKKETDHLIIYCKKGSYDDLDIEKACQDYEKAYLQMRTSIPSQIFNESQKIRIFLHNETTNTLMGWAYPDRYEAHYIYTRDRKLITSHEMMHVVLRQYNSKVPMRFEEGVCRYYEWQKIHIGNETAICEFYRLAKLRPEDEWVVQNVFLPKYKTKWEACIAAAFVSYLMENLGSETFWVFYKHLKKENYKLLLEQALHLDMKSINKNFKEYIKSLEEPPALFLEVQSK